MNRYRKYRIWDGGNMVYQDPHLWFNDVVLEGFPVRQSIRLHTAIIENMPVMEYTGINDITKRQVYEGDRTVDGIIEFNVETCCYVIRRANGTFIRLDVRKDKIEVVGNIYENPF